MRYHKIDTHLFVENRQRLSERLPPHSVVILLSNDRMPTNADGTLPFKQNSNLFYLTGIDQEDSILALAPDHSNEKLRAQLFLTETNANIAVWEGHKLSKEEGTALSGIEEVHWTSNFDASLKEILTEKILKKVNNRYTVQDITSEDLLGIEKNTRETLLNYYTNCQALFSKSFKSLVSGVNRSILAKEAIKLKNEEEKLNSEA